MNVLVINCGSSSLKFSIVEPETGRDLAKGLFDRLGEQEPTRRLELCGAGPKEQGSLPASAAHAEALEALADFLSRHGDRIGGLAAVGHRVVHGGERFTQAARIDDAALAAIESCSPLAPLHNPANLLGIRKSLEFFPRTPQIAVFDTAFHQTLDQEAYLYAIPLQLYREHRIRRYGFHGTSHKYVAHEAARLLDKPFRATSVITVHLGNGCSAAAIQNGRCVDTTMGLTPLEGLVMGTRSGDLDPGIIFHLRRSLGMESDEIDSLLNKKSGLLGLSELSNDMRTLRAAAREGKASAQLAIDVFTRRLAKSIAALRSTIEDLDAVVFTGGIGENDADTRSETLARLRHLGLELDVQRNAQGGRGDNGCITHSQSATKALVIPTNEELMIARETRNVIRDEQS